MVAPTVAGLSRTQAARVERLGRRFLRDCIASERSLFTPQTHIWTADNVADLHRRVIDTPSGGRRFAERAEAALSEAPSSVRQLFAEALVLHDLPLSRRTVKAATTLRTVAEILGSIDPPVTVPAAIAKTVEKALTDGPIDAGRGWMARRWVHLGVLLAFAEYFKAQRQSVRKRALADPAELRRLMLEVPADPELGQRHALLYTLCSDYFLPVRHPRDRVKLRDALAAEYLPVGSSGDVDADLRAIDDAVRTEHGGPVDYYLPPWRERWLPHRDQDSNGTVVADSVPAIAADSGPTVADAGPATRFKYHPLAPGTYQQSSAFRPPNRPDHNGIDFAADLGTPIYAPSDGFFAMVGPASGFGFWLVLDAQEPWGLDFVFGHMPSASLVNPDTGARWKVGDRVRAGQQIAVVGNEGESTGAHLHFETWSPPGRIGGSPRNPADTWLPDARDPRQAAADAENGDDQAAAATAPASQVGGLLLDYSAGVPAAADIAAQGFGGAVRYVSDPREPWMKGKPLTKSEADDLRAHGLAVVSNFQFGKRDWDGGAAQGQRDAERGLQLHAQAGGPDDGVIYVSVDADPTEQEWNTKVLPYLRAWQDRIGAPRMGIYCNYPCIDRAKRDGVGSYFWQHNWGSNGRIHPEAHLHQFEIDKQSVAGVGVDRNRILKADFGQWDHPSADGGALMAIKPGSTDDFPLPPNFYWGPLDGPEESWSNSAGTEPQYSKDGLKRWQATLGLPQTAVFDDITKAAAAVIQRAKGWAPTGTIGKREWDAVIRAGWGPAAGQKWPPAPALSTKDSYAQSIIAEGVRQNISPRGIKIALATALVETNMRMYANSNDPASMLLPHDAVGSDHMSVGLFQQQNFPEWKSLECRMDAGCSAGTFYEHLTAFDYNNEGLSPGSYADKVQRSAFPERYDQRFADASALYDRLIGTVDAADQPAPVDADSFPLPPGIYWGPLDGPDESWSNRNGTEPQYSRDGLRRWQQTVGIAATGIYDDATRDAALQLQQQAGLPQTGRIAAPEWDKAIRDGWRFTPEAQSVGGPPSTVQAMRAGTPTTVRGPKGYPIKRVTGPGFNPGHGPYLRIYLHTTENQDWVGTAEGVASYQERTKNDPRLQGSYHYIVDDKHIINTVATGDMAWGTLSDNWVSVHIAMVGTSGEIEQWSGDNPNVESRPKRREQWLAHDDMLDMVAYLIAIVSRDYGIPIERVDTEGVGNNRRGVSSHNNYTYGSVKLKGKKDGTHWDVPDTFPFDVVLAAAKGYEALVNDPDRFPLPPGIYWGPLDGPNESWSNRSGAETQASIDGLRRWQSSVGIPDTGVYDDATKDAALLMQQQLGWEHTGTIDADEWDKVIRDGWRPLATAAQPTTPATPVPVSVPAAEVRSPGGYPITWVGGPGYDQGHREYVRIYLHTTENQGWTTTAEDVAAGQERTKDIPNQQGSFHYIIDDTHIINTVATKNTAWGVQSDNPFSVQIAMVGTSGAIENWVGENPNREERPRLRDQWLAHDAMLDMLAYTIAIVSRDHNIPIERVDIEGIGANLRGISSHHNYTYGSVRLKGFKDGTHWDVPDTFPYDVVLAAAKGYSDIVNDPDRFPLPTGHYWGPLAGPTESWSNMLGGEPQSARDGLSRWQHCVGIPETGIYDAATTAAAAAVQLARGFTVDGCVHEAEWTEVIKRGWRLLPAAPPPPQPVIDPGPAVSESKKIKNATGPGLTDQFGMAATDLGVMTRTPSGRILAVFGDTFRGPRVGDADWRAPVALFSDTTRLDDGIVWSEAAGGVPNYATQLWPYPHDNPVFSTVLPSDVITIGNTIYLHVMVNKKLGEVVWTEIWQSTDDGHTWQHTGAKFDAALHDGLAQMWTWDLCEDGFVYILSTGFQRDKPLILRRVNPSAITDPTAYQSWGQRDGIWAWGNPPTPVLDGAGADDKFGELCLRRIQKQWVLVNFDSSNVDGYDIDMRVFDDITGDLNAAHKSTPIRGAAWGHEGDDAVAQLYGPSIIPGSRLDAGFHILLSQWKTNGPDQGWPYRAIQFKIPTGTGSGFRDDGAVNPHGGR